SVSGTTFSYPGSIENGTWTVAIGDGSTDFTGITETGEYTKLGQQYWINGNIAWTGKNSLTTEPIVIDLPATVGNADVSASIGYTSNVTFSTQMVLVAENGDNKLEFWRLVSGSTPVALVANDFGTAGDISFSLSFFV
ncbi:MAG: hypothetical protein N2B06_16960, partial [Clostridium sp.]